MTLLITLLAFYICGMKLSEMLNLMAPTSEYSKKDGK